MAMKRFIIRLAVFAAIAVALDFSVGVAFFFFCEMNRGGDVYRLAQIMDSMQDDVIIMGSSRAVHHYDPFIIEDSLGMSCQNCGFDGNGIIMQYALWKEITKRYYPKVLIYDVTPSFDLSADYDNHRYLSRLKPFYRSNPAVDSVFWDVDKKERVKMMAQTYQYNSNCMDVLAGWIHPLWTDEGKGYKPMEGKLIPKNVAKESSSVKLEGIKVDSLKLAYFSKLIADCRKGQTQLVVVISPVYSRLEILDYSYIQRLCKENKVLFIDYSRLFQNDNFKFSDNVHLNKDGADCFTKVICKRLKNI